MSDTVDATHEQTTSVDGQFVFDPTISAVTQLRDIATMLSMRSKYASFKDHVRVAWTADSIEDSQKFMVPAINDPELDLAEGFPDALVPPFANITLIGTPETLKYGNIANAPEEMLVNIRHVTIKELRDCGMMDGGAYSKEDDASHVILVTSFGSVNNSWMPTPVSSFLFCNDWKMQTEQGTMAGNFRALPLLYSFLKDTQTPHRPLIKRIAEIVDSMKNELIVAIVTTAMLQSGKYAIDYHVLGGQRSTSSPWGNAPERSVATIRRAE